MVKICIKKDSHLYSYDYANTLLEKQFMAHIKPDDLKAPPLTIGEVAEAFFDNPQLARGYRHHQLKLYDALVDTSE